MKVVINACYGGYGLSHAAVMRYAELKGMTLYPWIDEITKSVYGESATIDNPNIVIHYSTSPIREDGDEDARYERGTYFYPSRDIPRNDPTLIQVVEEVGGAANGSHAELKIVYIPDGVEFEVVEYDGLEHVAEAHRTWN